MHSTLPQRTIQHSPDHRTFLLWWSNGQLKFFAYFTHRIPHKIMDLITYPCPNFCQTMSVKEAPEVQCSSKPKQSRYHWFSMMSDWVFELLKQNCCHCSDKLSLPHLTMCCSHTKLVSVTNRPQGITWTNDDPVQTETVMCHQASMCEGIKLMSLISKFRNNLDIFPYKHHLSRCRNSHHKD